LHPGGGGATVKGKDACSPQAQAREVPYNMVMAELPIGLASLQRELAAGGKLPPVETWNPAHCGEIASRIARDGPEQHLLFTTDVGDQVIAGADHRLRLEVRASRAPSPYVHIRSGMEARISRSVFYQLAEIAIAGADGSACRLGVWSNGMFFPLEAAA